MGLIFPSSIGTPIESRSLVRGWHRQRERLGVPNCTFHSLRHSAASILLAMGANLHEVKETLGHSQISVTSDYYAHLFADARKEAAERVGIQAPKRPG